MGELIELKLKKLKAKRIKKMFNSNSYHRCRKTGRRHLVPLRDANTKFLGCQTSFNWFLRRRMASKRRDFYSKLLVVSWSSRGRVERNDEEDNEQLLHSVEMI